jgi:hypothetical protein
MSLHSELHRYLCVLCVRCRWRCVCGCESDSQIGYTALMHAAQFGRTDCARLLIDAGADIDDKNNVRVVRCFNLLGRLFYLFTVLYQYSLSEFSTSFTVSIALSLFKFIRTYFSLCFLCLHFNFICLIVLSSFFSLHPSLSLFFLPFCLRFLSSQELLLIFCCYPPKYRDIFLGLFALSRSHSLPSPFDPPLLNVTVQRYCVHGACMYSF